MLRTNRSLWVSAALEVGSALSKRTSNINMKASQQSQAPKRPDALAPQVLGKGPALGPAAVTPSPASKSYPPAGYKVRKPGLGRPEAASRPPSGAAGGSWVLTPSLTHLGGAWESPGGEWGAPRPVGRRLGSGASPAHNRRPLRRPRP